MFSWSCTQQLRSNEGNADSQSRIICVQYRDQWLNLSRVHLSNIKHFKRTDNARLRKFVSPTAIASLAAYYITLRRTMSSIRFLSSFYACSSSSNAHDFPLVTYTRSFFFFFIKVGDFTTNITVIFLTSVSDYRLIQLADSSWIQLKVQVDY